MSSRSEPFQLGSIDISAPQPRDRLTGFGNRRKLMADLERAVSSQSAPSVLAIFDLGGFKQYQRVLGHKAADALIVHISAVFEGIVGPAGACYRSREDELVTLIDGPRVKAMPLLAVAEKALRREGESSLITASFGSAILPDEANEPIAALALADQRLGAVTNRGPRERRHQSRNRED